MANPKLLYIDVSFATEIGGDMNRSRFLWKVLHENFDSDVVLIRKPGEESKEIVRPEGRGECLILQAASPVSLVHRFESSELDRFRELLKRGQYEYVVIRAASPTRLALEAERILPSAKIAVDTDLVLSFYTGQLWRKDRSWKNRYFLKESLRLARYERQLYRRPYLFFLANPEDQKALEKKYGGKKSRFSLLPNAISFQDVSFPQAEQRNILFFGALDSRPNMDAFIYLMDEIYSKIAAKLRETHTKIFVAGRNEQPVYRELVAKHRAEGDVQILGAVDNIMRAVCQSSFVVFPVLNGTGTRVRVLEAAKAKRTGVTTTLGAEGYEVDDGSLFVRDDATGYAEAVIRLLDEPALAERMGEQLNRRTRDVFGEEVVAKDFVQDLRSFQTPRRNIGFVVNRFYPEVGGAETNVCFQATELAKRGCQVTVYTPRRLLGPKLEVYRGFTIRRLWNLFNPFGRYPYPLPRTFCPTLAWRLLMARHDVVQSFPSIHYNATLSLAIQKLLGRKFILVSFDFRDYPTLIQRTGKVTDMLADYEATWKEKWVLEHVDHIYAIANKEIEFIRRHTDKVSYSPVPILLNEYELEAPSPRARYNIGSNEFVFLCLGRVAQIKGQDLALQAFEEALPRMPNSRLVIVGRSDYEPHFIEQMRSFIEERDLKDRVLFTGPVERSEVLGWLRHSDIHVVPVRFMNSGAVVVESWASGIPVIQSDVVDPNLVVDGENGYLFPSESVSHLANTMVRAYEDRVRFPEMASRGAALVREKYTYDYLTDLYLAKYDELIGKRGA